METAVSMVNTTNSSAALVATSPNPTTSTSNSSSTNANLHHGDKKNDQKIPSVDHCEDILKESFGGDDNATEKAAKQEDQAVQSSPPVALVEAPKKEFSGPTLLKFEKEAPIPHTDNSSESGTLGTSHSRLFSTETNGTNSGTFAGTQKGVASSVAAPPPTIMKNGTESHNESDYLRKIPVDKSSSDDAEHASKLPPPLPLPIVSTSVAASIGNPSVGINLSNPPFLRPPDHVIRQEAVIAMSNPSRPFQYPSDDGPPPLSPVPRREPPIPPPPFHQASKSIGFVQPQDNDVLFGRGGGTNFHQGNISYRKMIKNKQQAYINARQRSVKTQIISEIISDVRIQKPAGRFVKFDDRIKLWFEVDDKEVKKKTSQTLREGAPQWRKSHGEWKRRDDGGEQGLKRSALESSGPYSDVVRSEKARRNPASKKPKKLVESDSVSAADQSRTGLDLLTDAIFTLHPKKKKEVKLVKPPIPVAAVVQPTLDPAAEALRKWREDNKHVLDRAFI